MQIGTEDWTQLDTPNSSFVIIARGPIVFHWRLRHGNGENMSRKLTLARTRSASPYTLSASYLKEEVVDMT